MYRCVCETTWTLWGGGRDEWPAFCDVSVIHGSFGTSARLVRMGTPSLGPGRVGLLRGATVDEEVALVCIRRWVLLFGKGPGLLGMRWDTSAVTRCRVGSGRRCPGCGACSHREVWLGEEFGGRVGCGRVVPCRSRLR